MTMTATNFVWSFQKVEVGKTAAEATIGVEAAAEDAEVTEEMEADEEEVEVVVVKLLVAHNIVSS